jgi:hypothetical protein
MANGRLRRKWLEIQQHKFYFVDCASRYYYFVDCASRYIYVIKTNLMHVYPPFISSTSTCFGHICSPSSGGTLYIYNNWYVFCFLVDCLFTGRSTDSQQTAADDALQICPKHVEVDWRNKLRANSAWSWFSLHTYSNITFHSLQFGTTSAQTSIKVTILQRTTCYMFWASMGSLSRSAQFYTTDLCRI